jgi:hypothetical protein
MKKKKAESADWLRPEYKRSDFGKIVRGKYAVRIRSESNVVVLDPTVAKIFPNDEAVNTALRGIIKVAQTSARIGIRASKKRGKLARTG